MLLAQKRDHGRQSSGETITVPARITGRTVVRTETGIRVVALQVALLDGSIDNTVNLGEAVTRIRRG